ncbi:hypothetical protein [Actinomadura macra]|uniref:hypothetical protein n=1 Tax=Actinomadura macra TaxID=46164 RepID=UPI0012F93240|nr:hypothetical protein [Actinomadura macra]
MTPPSRLGTALSLTPGAASAAGTKVLTTARLWPRFTKAAAAALRAEHLAGTLAITTGEVDGCSGAVLQSRLPRPRP